MMLHKIILFSSLCFSQIEDSRTDDSKFNLRFHTFETDNEPASTNAVGRIQSLISEMSNKAGRTEKMIPQFQNYLEGYLKNGVDRLSSTPVYDQMNEVEVLDTLIGLLQERREFMVKQNPNLIPIHELYTLNSASKDAMKELFGKMLQGVVDFFKDSFKKYP